jgi:hypothetical protein
MPIGSIGSVKATFIAGASSGCWAAGCHAARGLRSPLPSPGHPGQDAGGMHKSGARLMEPELTVPTMEAIRRWSGVAVPNQAARLGLEDFVGLIAALESLHGTMVFEDEPSSFEAALRDCKEPG